MADLLRDIADRVRHLASDWTKYTLVGSFLLYVAGYLALRFHLTAIGIGTDLTVVDERYLFTGANFLVYLVGALTSLLLIVGLVVAVRKALGRILRMPGGLPMPAWSRQPTNVAVVAMVISLFMIQFVMRQPLLLRNLYLARDLPAEPAYLARLLTDNDWLTLYYLLLVAGCAVPAALLVALRDKPVPPVLRGVLAFLVAVQLLLLPVNYGVLVLDKELPRVRAVGQTALTDGQDAWLVWEGKDGVTYLVRDRHREERALVTVPRAEVKRTEIVAFDRIFPMLFANHAGGQ